MKIIYIKKNNDLFKNDKPRSSQNNIFRLYNRNNNSNYRIFQNVNNHNRSNIISSNTVNDTTQIKNEFNSKEYDKTSDCDKNNTPLKNGCNQGFQDNNRHKNKQNKQDKQNKQNKQNK